MRLFILFLVTFHLFSFTEALENRPSSSPYISGDTFRKSCDFIVDETGSNLDPMKVKKGDTIFLKTDYLEHFFLDIHPLIVNPYVLVTHNSDYAFPRNFRYMLNDSKLLAWYGQNLEGEPHPKLHAIPIGLANMHYLHGNITLVKDVQNQIHKDQKNIFLYMNFQTSTYPNERSLVYSLFEKKPYCTKRSPTDFKAYLLDLAKTKFVLSPRGNGLDCHRTWEALLMGAIPIFKTSSLDPMFEGLPVLIVQDWNQVTEVFLKRKWREMKDKKFNYKKIYANYWLSLISSHKQ